MYQVEINKDLLYIGLLKQCLSYHYFGIGQDSRSRAAIRKFVSQFADEEVLLYSESKDIIKTVKELGIGSLLGNYSTHKSKRTHIPYEFRDKMEWEPNEFRDDNSCYFDEDQINYVREYLNTRPEFGACCVRVSGADKKYAGNGRFLTWSADKDKYMVAFNVYGLQSTEVFAILGDKYKHIYIVELGSYDDAVYVNNNTGYYACNDKDVIKTYIIPIEENDIYNFYK